MPARDLLRRLLSPFTGPCARVPIPLEEQRFVDRAAELAHEAEARGNVPIGAVIVLDGRVVAEGRNAVRVPVADRSRHAEIEALAVLPPELIARAAEMTCYASLEPCEMCVEALRARGIERIVYGAPGFLPRRPPAPPIEWIGPVGDKRSRALRRRVRRSALRRLAGR